MLRYGFQIKRKTITKKTNTPLMKSITNVSSLMPVPTKKTIIQPIIRTIVVPPIIRKPNFQSIRPIIRKPYIQSVRKFNDLRRSKLSTFNQI